MKPKAVDFVAYIVKDMTKSEPFYRDVLGLEVTQPWSAEQRMPFMELEAGGTTISLTQLPREPMNGAIALAVDDAKEAIEELRAKGVTVAMEVVETGDCFMAAIEDPDGNQIIIHQRKDGTAG
jgi:predicted enzyme related to lactoylglutathione lyase